MPDTPQMQKAASSDISDEKDKLKKRRLELKKKTGNPHVEVNPERPNIGVSEDYNIPISSLITEAKKKSCSTEKRKKAPNALNVNIKEGSALLPDKWSTKEHPRIVGIRKRIEEAVSKANKKAVQTKPITPSSPIRSRSLKEDVEVSHKCIDMIIERRLGFKVGNPRHTGRSNHTKRVRRMKPGNSGDAGVIKDLKRQSNQRHKDAIKKLKSRELDAREADQEQKLKTATSTLARVP